jgi:hypothetical protein
MDILNFCNDHKIRCFGYDWMMKEFISNKDLNIDFHSHLPAFVFYFNDHHIYLINDKDVRHALLNCNKTVNVCAPGGGTRYQIACTTRMACPVNLCEIMAPVVV